MLLCASSVDMKISVYVSFEISTFTEILSKLTVYVIALQIVLVYIIC